MTRFPSKPPCPKCDAEDSRVTDSRPSATYLGGIRRRRTCLTCNHRFSTIEFVETAFDGKTPPTTIASPRHTPLLPRAVIMQRMNARFKLRRAVVSGRLTRQACERCGAPDTEAHHSDYSRPLDVQWLCPACHRAKHREKPICSSDIEA